MPEEGDAATTANAGTNPAPTTTLTPAPVNPPNPYGFTAEQQATVDRLIAGEKANTERARVKALLGDLGFDKLEDLKTLVQTHRQAEDAARTEVERAIARANEEKVAAASERASIANERHTLHVERALMAAGAQGDLAKVARLVEVEVGAEIGAVMAAIEAAKTDFPSLFKPAQAGLPSSEPSGGGAPSRPSNSPDAYARGEERAKLVNEGKRFSS